jgi:hypothetical protein
MSVRNKMVITRVPSLAEQRTVVKFINKEGVKLITGFKIQEEFSMTEWYRFLYECRQRVENEANKANQEM